MTDLPQQPLVSIDTVPLILRNGRWCVVLAKRALEPFAGQAALPGVLLRPMERLFEAAMRALETKGPISEENVLYLMGAGAYDNPDRDPRGPTLSISHLAVVAPEGDPAGAVFRSLGDTGELPFDHEVIIMEAAGVALDALWVNETLTRAMLGDSFSTSDVARLVRELSAGADRNEPDTSNLGRELAKKPRLVKSGAPAAPRGKGRPAAAWTWVD